ncbi:MAG: hypothetical protein ACR2J9_10005 [Gaiellales bacterium]
MVRHAFIVAVLVLLAAVPAASAKVKTPGILYALDASSGEVVHGGDGYRLSMPAATRVTWFSDRPARQSGTMTLRGLVSIWRTSGFAADPPNAAVILASEGAELTHVVELRRPRVAGGSVTFALREVPTGMVMGHRHADGLVPGTYRHAAVFIDDAANPPCLSAINAVAGTSTTCLLASSPAGRTTIYPPRASRSSTSTTVTYVSGCASGSAFTMALGTGYVDIPTCGQGLASFMQLASNATTMPAAQTISNVLMLSNGTTATSPSSVVLTVNTVTMPAPPPAPANSASPSLGVTLVGVTTVTSSG